MLRQITNINRPATSNICRTFSIAIARYRVSLFPQAAFMDLQLTGKTALVLAASKGLGKACATTLAAEGANVVIGARDRNTLDAAAREIGAKAGGRVLAVPVDVMNADDAQNIVNTTVKEFGCLDILINNAGGPPFGKF